MQTKTIASIFSTISFALGFIFSRLIYKHDQNQKECVKTEINTNLREKVKNDEKSSKKIVYKTFYKTGEIKSEKKEEIDTTKIHNFLGIEKNYKMMDYKKNWQVGFLYKPGTYDFDKKNIALQVSYNIVSDVWVSAQTNAEFKTMFGVMYQF